MSRRYTTDDSIQIERNAQQRDLRAHLRVRYSLEQDELMPQDALAVLVDGKPFFGIVESCGRDGTLHLHMSQHSRFEELESRSKHPGEALSNVGAVKVFLLASLSTAKRCYEALNWYHTADLSANPVMASLYQKKPPLRSNMPLPRSPVHLNASQGQVVVAMALLEQGALLCQVLCVLLCFRKRSGGLKFGG